MVITVSRSGLHQAHRAPPPTGRSAAAAAAGADVDQGEDEVEKLFVASTHAVMLFFSSEGRVFARKVHELPDVGPGGRGRALVNLLQLESEERVPRCSRCATSPSTRTPSCWFATRLARSSARRSPSTRSNPLERAARGRHQPGRRPALGPISPTARCIASWAPTAAWGSASRRPRRARWPGLGRGARHQPARGRSGGGGRDPRPGRRERHPGRHRPRLRKRDAGGRLPGPAARAATASRRSS